MTSNLKNIRESVHAFLRLYFLALYLEITDSTNRAPWLNMYHIINATLCCFVLFLVVFGVVVLSFNLLLLRHYRKRSFFRKRSINLLILTIIPSSIEVFILVPISTISQLIGTHESAINLRVLLHTTCINIWFCTMYTRLWYVFVQIRKQQDSLEWKKVCVYLLKLTYLFNYLLINPLLSVYV